MGVLFGWLNDNAGAIQAITTGILVFITYRYTRLTSRLAESTEEAARVTKEQLEATFRPYLTIRTSGIAEDDARVLFLSVTNTGQSAAEDVELKLDRSFHVNGEPDAKWDLSTAHIFSRTIPYFPPGQEFVFLLGDHQTLFESGAQRKGGSTPKEFAVLAKYNYRGKPITGAGERTAVNLEQYELSLPPKSPLVRELKGIREAISKRSAAP